VTPTLKGPTFSLNPMIQSSAAGCIHTIFILIRLQILKISGQSRIPDLSSVGLSLLSATNPLFRYSSRDGPTLSYDAASADPLIPEDFLSEVDASRELYVQIEK
jgi:hypothetical protein